MSFGKKDAEKAEEIRIRDGTGDRMKKLKELNETDDKKIMEETIEYLLSQPQMSSDLLTANNGSKNSENAKANIMLQAKRLLETRKLSAPRISRILEMMKRFLWGYFILEPLIDDEDISDIRVMSYNTIAVCRNGEYSLTDLSFDSPDEYGSFMQSIAVMNQISLADISALSIVTDKNSNPDWRLRISIATGYVNSADTYFLHIRKHPKQKRSLEDLERLGMMSHEIAEYLRRRKDYGMYITGQTGSGKTHLMNAMMDLVQNEPGICIQESEELFASDPKSLIVFLHMVLKKGEGKIKYDLEDESKFGLLTSNKRFTIGEIKGAEATYFANACYTGSVCWATGHGDGCTDGMDKLVDYVMRYTGYDERFAKKMLKKLDTVIFVKDYRIMEIQELTGFDDKTCNFIYKQKYKREEGQK